MPLALYMDHHVPQAITLGLIRVELVKLLFRRSGVWFFKRYKHLSEVLPAEYLSDVEKTYDRNGNPPMDRSVIARETLMTLEMVGKHLELMGREAGGGFEPEWWAMMLATARDQLNPFINQEAAGV